MAERPDQHYGDTGIRGCSNERKFCADAGLVAVFLLDEVLKYNPDFRYHINKPWTTTLIKDFDGEVKYYLDKDTSAHILGIGNVNFCTTQTGY